MDDNDAKRTGDCLRDERAMNREGSMGQGRRTRGLEACNGFVNEQDADREILGCGHMRDGEDARWLTYEVELLHPLGRSCNHHRHDVIARLRAYKIARAKGTKENRRRE